MNAVVGLTPGLDIMPWTIRTVVVVTLDFLIPATVLGMIGPVVAKMAVEQARKAGSAIGDVYFMGAVGSIAGTFLAGFVLMYYAPISAIVTVVAAALALLAGAMLGGPGLVVGLAAAVLLGAGSVPRVASSVPVAGLTLGSITVNPVALAGHVMTVVLALIGLGRLNAARAAAAAPEDPAEVAGAGTPQPAAVAGAGAGAK